MVGWRANCFLVVVFFSQQNYESQFGPVVVLQGDTHATCTTCFQSHLSAAAQLHTPLKVFVIAIVMCSHSAILQSIHRFAHRIQQLETNLQFCSH